MALAYTAPTWEDGSGTGISASQLQAISDCIEGLVQGTDKAIHAFSMSSGVFTITFADGSQETTPVADLKGVTSIVETSHVGVVHTYTVTYTDGTTTTLQISDGTNGTDGTDGRDGAIQYTAGSGINISGSNEISVVGKLDGAVAALATSSDGSTVTFSDVDLTKGYSLFADLPNTYDGPPVGYSNIKLQISSGDTGSIIYTLVNGAANMDFELVRVGS